MDIRKDDEAEGETDEPVTQSGSVLYGVEDVPSPLLCFLFGLQVTFLFFYL